MAKKHWIFLKRGLSTDPKHRERIGQAIWGFMHIIDRADWETGIVHDWKDKDEAEDMGINHRTLRDWRQKLDAKNYITCQQKQHSQDIIIHNWINPRDYSSQVLNVLENQGDKKTAPQESQGDTQGDTQGVRKSVTPTSSSLSTSQPGKKGEKRGDLVDGLIEFSQMPGAKRAIRLDGITSRLAVALNIHITYSRWEDFIKHAADREQEAGETVEKFIDWIQQKPNFDLQYWPPDKMLEVWPQAFSENGNNAPQNIVRAPSTPRKTVSVDALTGGKDEN